MKIESFAFWIEMSLLIYFVSINLLYTLFLAVAGFGIVRRSKEIDEEDTSPILKSEFLPSIVFIVPSYNGERYVIQNISNILLLSYRYKKIILVNDGSTDQTMKKVIKDFELIEVPKYFKDEIPTLEIKKVYRSKIHPEIIVIDKLKGGKFDAVNAGINAASTPFFAILDVDTFVDSKQFESLVRPILTNPETIGVGASIRVMNGCTIDYNRVITAQFPRHFIPALQSLEYLRSFCLRDGLDAVNANFILAGAFSIFRRDIIIRAGGYGPSCAEDAEIVIRLHRLMREGKKKYKIQYFSDPVSFTEVPENLKSLGKQRVRWHLGILESLWIHKRVFMNPRYGSFGLFGYPFWVFSEAIEPLVEAFAWTYLIVFWMLGILQIDFFLFVFAATIGYTSLYTIFALFLEEFSYRKYPSFRSLWMLLIANLVENIGYRQLTIYWRIKGCCIFAFNILKNQRMGNLINGWIKKAHEKALSER